MTRYAKAPTSGRSSHFGRTALFALLLLGAMALPAASALAVKTHPLAGSFGPDGTTASSFANVQGVAVDRSSGDVYVYDAGEGGKIYKFDSVGNPENFSALTGNVIEGVGAANNPGEEQLAVAPPGSPAGTAGDIYLAREPSVFVYAPSGAPLGTLTEAGACGVATDPAGHVFTGVYPETVNEYTPTANEPYAAELTATSEGKVSEVCNVAADGLGNIYASRFNRSAIVKLEGIGASNGTSIEPGATTLTVSPSNDLYANRSSEVVQYSSTGAFVSSFGSGRLKDSYGIATNSAGEIYVSKGDGKVDIYGPEVVTLPEATTEAASFINGNVTLRGVINAAGGPPATCVFQYVEIQAEGFEGATSVPCAPADPFTGTVGASVSAEISGLPEAAFRFRLLASNEEGSLEGGTLLFNTFKRVSGLPDNRAYEMVSPPQKLGEVIPPDPNYALGGRWGKSCLRGECLPGANIGLGPMQSAPDGEAIVYLGQPFSAGLAADANEYLSRRSAGGWGTPQSLSPVLSSRGSNQGFKAVSPDLSRGVLYQIEPVLSPEAPVREGEGFANLYLTDSAGSLRPLITQAPPHREPGSLREDFNLSYGGANAGSATAPAFSHIVFAADDALTGEVPGVAPAAPETEASGCNLLFESCNLYEWTGGTLRLVNVLPGNETATPGAVFGSGRLLTIETTAFSEGFAAAVDHAVSADGTRIFWTDEETGQLYVRIDGERTEKIADPGIFLTASTDGSKVLLDDGCLYDLEVEPPVQPCEDLTAGKGEFEGILGASDGLSRIYFVDRAVLSGNEKNANGEAAEPEAFNLYAWQEGATTFIGRLSEGGNVFTEVEDNQIGPGRGFGAWVPSSLNRTAQVSRDGRFLAFMSKASLTGYDNRVSEVTGEGCQGEINGSKFGGTRCFEVFAYDADSGSLTCASCNPTGQRPLGQSNLSLLRKPVGRQPTNLSADGQGRLFFESQDVLSARDTNGAIQDVYEWEPNGVGSCSQANGCVSLISSGRASGDSFFLDGTPSGNDAFIVTRERLLPQDRDDRLDLYDARVGGGIEAGSTASCDGEACKGPISSAPQLGSPASAEFSGPGNLKHKKHKKKKAKHKKKQHQRSAKRNSGGVK